MRSSNSKGSWSHMGDRSAGMPPSSTPSVILLSSSGCLALQGSKSGLGSDGFIRLGGCGCSGRASLVAWLRNGDAEVEFPISVDVLELGAIGKDCSVGAAEPRWAVGDAFERASKAGEFAVELLRDLWLDRDPRNVSTYTSAIPEETYSGTCSNLHSRLNFKHCEHFDKLDPGSHLIFFSRHVAQAWARRFRGLPALVTPH